MHGHDTPVVIPDPRGYESEDVILAPVIKWVAYLLIFVTVSAFVTWFIYLYMLPKQNYVGATNRFSFERRLPPEPRVQALPKTEMKDFRLDEQERTGSAGWVDRQKGTVRIPIEQAMEDAVKNGIEGAPKSTSVLEDAKNKPQFPADGTTLSPRGTKDATLTPTETKPAEPKSTPTEAEKPKPANP